ncbi:hypothetical protein H4217_002206 [Coemansia sp. RSA 1939]|nr:hypothetical protein H4217_002206 [Coemansia sp. RSA 1939]KAJ2617417.1 hypothetical protein EV177_000574 [Coemansia sp. RSA 1804]
MVLIYHGVNSAACSQDSLVSAESSNSRALLLSPGAAINSQPQCSLEQRESELEDIILRHTRSQVSASMESQRVVLSSAKKRDIQAAQLASALNRMSRLRFSNQDCLPRIERRASDIQGFFEKLDRLSVDRLADDQRYSPVYQVA